MEKQLEKINRTFTGTVVSTKMVNTVVVLIEKTAVHKKYNKRYKTSKKFKVHNTDSQIVVGDTVVFQECRPLSTDKRWRVIKKVTTK